MIMNNPNNPWSKKAKNLNNTSLKSGKLKIEPHPTQAHAPNTHNSESSQGLSRPTHLNLRPTNQT